MRILLVEDERNIRDVIKMNLEMDGYEVIHADQGTKALDLIQQQHFDLMVLDIMLPDISGIDVCKTIRLENFSLPIIIVSAKDSSEDRIKGLKAGADDYLVKPFDLTELELRIGKLIHRSKPQSLGSSEYYEFGSNKVNLLTYEAITKHGKIRLTKKEAKLLKLLFDHEGQAISRKQIFRAVWGYDVYPATRTIDNFVLAFRKYFEEDPKNPRYFHSVRGVGYQFRNSS